MSSQPEPTPPTALVDGETVTFALADVDTVTLAEVVEWSYRPEYEQCLSNPEFADFAKRYEISEFRRVMEASVHLIAP